MDENIGHIVGGWINCLYSSRLGWSFNANNKSSSWLTEEWKTTIVQMEKVLTSMASDS